MKASLPIAVVDIITSEEWKGGDLIQVDSEIARATSTDIVVNYPWLKPFVMKFRESVPSGFFCTDDAGAGSLVPREVVVVNPARRYKASCRSS